MLVLAAKDKQFVAFVQRRCVACGKHELVSAAIEIKRQFLGLNRTHAHPGNIAIVVYQIPLMGCQI